MPQDITPLFYLNHFLPRCGLGSPFWFCSGAVPLLLAGLLQHNAKPGSNHGLFTLKKNSSSF